MRSDTVGNQLGALLKVTVDAMTLYHHQHDHDNIGHLYLRRNRVSQ